MRSMTIRKPLVHNVIKALRGYRGIQMPTNRKSGCRTGPTDSTPAEVGRRWGRAGLRKDPTAGRGRGRRPFPVRWHTLWIGPVHGLSPRCETPVPVPEWRDDIGVTRVT